MYFVLGDYLTNVSLKSLTISLNEIKQIDTVVLVSMQYCYSGL